MDGAASSFHALIKLLHWESGWKATLVFYWLRSHLNSTYWLSSLCGRSQKNDIIICEYIPSSSWLCVSYVHRLLYISNWLKWKKKKKVSGEPIWVHCFISWLGNLLPFSPSLIAFPLFPGGRGWGEAYVWLRRPGIFLLQTFFQWPQCLPRSTALARKSHPCPFTVEVVFVQEKEQSGKI